MRRCSPRRRSTVRCSRPRRRKSASTWPKFQKALDTHTHQAAVDADAAAAGAAQITGTPAFLINDYSLSGAQPLPKFRRLIDRALSDKAQKKP